tara:strand:- start:569 stop:715 length:147 start_codon:yes stop_codon:yes gene_type:complete
MSKEEKIEALENLINRFWYINNYDLDSEDQGIIDEVEKVKKEIKSLEE